MSPSSMASRGEVGFGFWLQWVGLTVLAFGLSLYWIEVGYRSDLGAIAGGLGGLCVGAAQGWRLRSCGLCGWRWALATSLGWAVLGLLGVGALGWVVPQTNDIGPRLVYGLLDGIKVGVILGSAQWWVLRQGQDQTWLWIPVNVVSWSTALAMGWTVGGLLRQITGVFWGEVVGLGIVWLVAAMLSGLNLVGLLGDRPRKAFLA